MFIVLPLIFATHTFPGMQTLYFLTTKRTFLCNLPHITRGISLPKILVLRSRSSKLEQCRGPVCLSRMAIVNTPGQQIGENFGWHGANTALHSASYNGVTMRKMCFLWPNYNGQFLGWSSGVYF